MKRFPLLLAAGLLMASTHAFDAAAWGAQGHRLVARIAETRLDAPAQQAVAELLAGEADPTLHGVAAWADELRGNDPVLGRRTAGWHYVNVAEHDCHYLRQRDCANGNCVTEAFRTQTAVLADRSQPLEARRQALKFVVHLVGDIHQPMHAGYAHDKGGNDFQLQFKGRGTNLHALWDSGMIYDRRLDDDAYLAVLQALPAPPVTELARSPRDPEQWTEASCRIAIQPGVYPPRHVLADDYVERYRPLAENHLRLAGERLAVLLNDVLGTP